MNDSLNMRLSEFALSVIHSDANYGTFKIKKENEGGKAKVLYLCVTDDEMIKKTEQFIRCTLKGE